MEEQIVAILQKNFAGATVMLQRDSRGELINGNILWEGFEGHGFPWRQHKIYRVLKKALGKEADVVSHIFTYTPNEYEQMMAA